VLYQHRPRHPRGAARAETGGKIDLAALTRMGLTDLQGVMIEADIPPMHTIAASRVCVTDSGSMPHEQHPAAYTVKMERPLSNSQPTMIYADAIGKGEQDIATRM